MLSTLFPLALFAFVSSITPGPNNIMLTSSGIVFGFLRTIPHMLGITFGFGAPLGYVAATRHFDLAALLLYLAVFFWILGYDTIYAHQDREDDALVGVRSTARLFADTSRPFLAVCFTLTVALLVASGLLAGLSAWFLLVVILPAALLAREVIVLDVNDPGLCLALFKSNKWVGLAVGLALIAGRL